MALIKCSECGKEISDKAASCPNCGCPVSATSENTSSPTKIKQRNVKLPKEKKIKKSKILLGLLCTVLVIFAIFFIRSNFSRYDWNDAKLSILLPEPESKWGKLSSNSEGYLSLSVHRFTSEDYNEYVTACADMGFSIDVEQADNSYSAYNEAGYELDLYYSASDKRMRINMDAPMEMGTIEWSDSEIAALLPIPNATEGKIKRDDAQGFEVYLKNTSKSDLDAYIYKCKELGFTHNYEKEDDYYYAQNADGYQFTAEYNGGNVVFLSIIEPQKTLELQFVSTNSKCDVEVRIDDSYECTVDHGDSETRTVKLGLGKHTIKVENDDDDEIYDYCEINVTEDEYLKFEIQCTKNSIQIVLLSAPKENNIQENDVETKISSEDETKPSSNTEIENNPTTSQVTATEKETIDLAKAKTIFEDVFDMYSALIDDFSDLLDYCSENTFTSLEEINEYEDQWVNLSQEAYQLADKLITKIPPNEVEDEWTGFADRLMKIGSILFMNSTMDANLDGHYDAAEMESVINTACDEFVAVSEEIIDIAKEFNNITGGDTVSIPDNTSTSNSNNGKKCEECGKNATKSVNLFGQTEYYCTTHYNEIMDILDMMESDVGQGSASKHTCEECSNEGTHSIIGFSGQMEYYCTKHYNELKEMLEMFN